MEKKLITYKDIIEDEELAIYIEYSDKILGVLGFTDHSREHTLKVADLAGEILEVFHNDERKIQLVKIASYLHDIGNMINRYDHSHTGALIAFNILREMGMEPKEIAIITSAIGNHDESTSIIASPIVAALIISDKCHVHRSRVRNTDQVTFDIHDRVNHAVVNSEVDILKDEKKIILKLEIDTEISTVMDYFEIFLQRMLMCKKAANYLETEFQLWINGTKLS